MAHAVSRSSANANRAGWGFCVICVRLVVVENLGRLHTFLNYVFVFVCVQPFAPVHATRSEATAVGRANVVAKSAGPVRTVASVSPIRAARTAIVVGRGNATVAPAGAECCAMRVSTIRL